MHKRGLPTAAVVLCTVWAGLAAEAQTLYVTNPGCTSFVDADGVAVSLAEGDTVAFDTDAGHFSGSVWSINLANLAGRTVTWSIAEGNLNGLPKDLNLILSSNCTAYIRSDIKSGTTISGDGRLDCSYNEAPNYTIGADSTISCATFTSTKAASFITINGAVTITSETFTLNGSVKLSPGASLTVPAALDADKVALSGSGARLRTTTQEGGVTYVAQPIEYDENRLEPYHWYRFDGDTENAGAEPFTMAANAPTVYCPDGAAHDGRAFNFADGNQRIYGNDSGFSLGDGDWTISIVGKLPSNANGALFCAGSVSWSPGKALRFLSQGGTGLTVDSNGSGSEALSLAAEVADASTAFHAYALTYVAETKRYTLYVDGEEAASATSDFVFAGDEYQFGNVHGQSGESSKATDGAVDDFRVYHRSLTAKQLRFVAATFGCVDLKALVPHTFVIANDGNFKLDGTNFLIRCAEMHFARIPRPYWRQRIQMAKAGGFNAVCAYMFWNNHEPEKGYYRFTDDQDISAFCRLAEEEGMWIVLRPGPYVCAEWEYGGFPWWLRKEKVAVRTLDEKYMQYSRLYLNRVFQEVGEQQITRGGNILMVQVENEYGFFGSDTAYMRACYNVTKDAGFTVPFFCCAPKNYLSSGYIPELFPVINGGGGFTGAGGGFETLQKLRRGTPWEGGPLMVGEYYPAWYDSWGNAHQTKSTQDCVNDLTAFCTNNASFSMYMTHGGTSFGWWGGFNEATQAMTPSYDYNAPISEAGHYTEKFWAFKAVLDQHLNAFETAVPSNAVPSEIPVQTASCAAEAQYASFWDMPDEQFSFITNDVNALTFELSDLGYGYLLYETTIPAGLGGTMTATVKDVGVVRIDGEEVGYFDYRYKNNGILVAAAATDRKLQIFVEAFGRSHFYLRRDVDNGIQSEVKIGDTALTGWTMKTFNLIEHRTAMDNVTYSADTVKSARSASLYKYTVNLEYGKDAFLDMHDWKRGMVCLNGRWLGRYWSIGPQQTLYVPGCWLNESGVNELIVLDLIGADPPSTLSFVADHVIDELRTKTDYYRAPPLHPAVPDGYLTSPVKTGELANVRTVQTNLFDAVQTGRYVGITITSGYAGSYTACAEFGLVDAAGNALDRGGWTIAACTSEEYVGEQAQAEKMLDGDATTFWHSEWKVVQSQLPQSFVLDLGTEQTIGGFTWQARETTSVMAKGYSVYVLTYGIDEEPPAAEGFIVAGGTREDPVDISGRQNTAVTILSNSVAKIDATGNVTFTVTGSGASSELILAGTKDWGFDAGSRLENLTLVVDDPDNIFWFDSRTPAIFDETVDVFLTNASPVMIGGGIVTIGSLSGTGSVAVNGRGALVITDPVGGTGFTGTLPANTTVVVGGTDVTAGCTDGRLDAAKAVTVAGETIPVAPTLAEVTGDDLVGSVPFAVTEAVAALGVKTIPGLTYQLVRTTALEKDASEVGVDAKTADGVRTKLEDRHADRPKERAFYRIRIIR